MKPCILFTQLVFIHPLIICKKLLFRDIVCLVVFHILVVKIYSITLFDQRGILLQKFATTCNMHMYVYVYECMNDLCDRYTHKAIL